MNTTSHSRFTKTVGHFLLCLLPLLFFIFAWELATAWEPKRQFIFSTPLKVWNALITLTLSGSLFKHACITVWEAVCGFLLGTSLGAVVGLSFWHSRLAARIARPYISMIGSIPIFAMAPIIIVWFGIGITSKIALAFLPTFIVAVTQSYQGAMSVEQRFLRMMQVVGAKRMQVFRLLVIPSSIVWVVNAMKLNIGLALLGAFVGEFISSEQGLGYLIVKASGLYDMATVFAGVIALAAIALILTAAVDQLERYLLRWKAPEAT